ncbi:hypothetical protein BS78_03G319900 [Paspalum vaginatum]|nr:hypothetical protein BS78_03G319900 [Paspalum vaginatum]
MAAALLSLTSLYIFLGVLAALAVLCAIVWAVRRCQDGRAKEGGVSSATGGKQEGLLTKKSNEAVVVVDVPQLGGGPEPPSTGAVEVELCAICKAPLADTGWGGRRRLRPCGHVYHADCVDLWLQRKRICPVCRTPVPVSWADIMHTMA